MSFRKIAGAVAVSAGVITGSLVAVPPTAGAAGSPFDDEIGDQLALASASLAQASMLVDLLPVIPGLEANPAMLLGVHELFVGGSGFAGLASLATSTDLATDLPALSGSGFTLSNYEHATSGTTHTVSFDVQIDKVAAAPIAIIDGDVQILGTDVDIDVTMPNTTITLEFEAASATEIVPGSFAFVELPSLDFSVSLSGSPTIPIQFGFASATASGDFGLNLSAGLQLTDPDGLDRITISEFSTLAIEDLIQLDFPTNTPDDIDIDLALDADVFGTGFGGQLTITDENFFSDPAPVTTFTASGANPIDLLSNISADTAITSLAQLVSSYGAAMLAGDVELPFLSDGVFIPGDLGSADLSDFDRVFDAIQPLMDYVTPRSSGQIVCGTEVGPDPDGAGGVEGIPTGMLIELEPNQPVFCRAFTSIDGSAQWKVNGASVGAPSTTTIGADPTANIELAASATGDFAVAVDFTPGDGSGLVELLPRPDTIQDLLTELAANDLIPLVGGDPDFDYDPAAEAFTFPFDFGVAGPIEREASINAGNSLVAATGITGLSADAAATARYSLSNIAAGVTLGLIVTDDISSINPGDDATNPEGPLDRFFLSGVDSLIEVGDVQVAGDFAMNGRLGFLEVDANVTGSLSSPGAAPALSVGLTGTTVESNGATISDAILVRDVLGPSLVDLVDADVNLQFDGAAAISAEAAGLGAGGGFDIEWNLDDSAPSITNFDAGFTNTLLPFGGDLALVHDGAASPTDPTLFTGTTATNLLAEPGLVGSQLVDTAGNFCNITAVLSATQLTCSNPDGDTLNPITFADGDSYDVKGNTLSKLADILAALDGLIAYLEDAVGSDAFDTPIDLIGVSPADIVGQIDELRRMVDEFRGVQDAYIQCVVQGDAAADVRAVPLDTSPPGPPPAVTLQCAAEAFADSPTGVQWRVVPADGAPGAFVADTDGDSLSGSPDPEVAFEALTISADLDTDGDGFVSLGSEYSIEVEWSDATGGKQAAFPPRIPQSLQQLESLINDTLGLPDGVVSFSLEDGSSAPGDPTLRVAIGYGICSADDFVPGCDGMPIVPGPSADLNFDLGGGIGDLVGLDVDGEIVVDYAALATLDVGIPLDGSDPVLYGSTGIDARLQVEGSDDLSITASIGPVNARIGAAATGASGSAEAGSADGTLVAVGAFPASAVSVGMVVTETTTGETCVITARTDDDTVQCATDWEEGDAFQLGGRNDLSAGLGLELQLKDTSPGGGIVGDDDFVTFSDAGVEVTDPGEILDGGECGPIDEATMSQIAGSTFTAGERSLGGFACAQLSLSAELGTQVYLGELDVELVVGADPVRAWVPTDLGAKLGAAALDPAFLLRLLPDLLEAIEDGMRDAADSGLPSAVGDPLRTGAAGIEATRLLIDGYIETFADALAGLAPGGTLEGAIADELAGLLGLDAGDIAVVALCGGATECADGDPLSAITDIRATFTFGDMVEATTGVNLGLDGLPLNVEGGVTAFAEWGVTLGIGVSRDDGPYIALDGAAPEFLVSAGVNLAAGATGCDGPINGLDYTTDRCISARLGFLDVEALDSTTNPTSIGARLGLDVAGGSADRLTLADMVNGTIDLTPVVAAGINLDVHLRTGVAATGPDLPSITGTFLLQWQVGTYAATLADSTLVPIADVTGVPSPTISFDNLHLDLGDVLDEFIKPITNEIKKITGPLQPIVDVITAPIPVVSDLAELVGEDPITMLSVLEGATGADLSLIKALAAFIGFVNSVPDDSGLIPLGALIGGTSDRAVGAFEVDPAKAAGTLAPSEAGSLIKQDSSFKGGTGFTNDVGEAGDGSLNTKQSPDPDRPSTFGVPGLSFPFLEDASQVFGVLVGRDATLIRWDAGTLKASAGISYDFGPIMVGPIPITITLGGEIGIEGRFAIGYDTSGIRKLLDGGSGVALFDGIFIDDLDAQGNDVPEIVFKGRVFAGASVDLVIVSAGVRGGIELTFTLDLDDRPDPDGKLRIEEIVDKLANPICLFEVGGKIEAFLEAFVKIDLFLFSKEFGFELVRITLLEWSSACEPPAPKPATKDGGVLYLNIGERRDLRNVQEDVVDESIEVRQLGPGKVRVTAFGFEEVFTGIELIVADGGVGDDEILMLPGSDDELVDATDPDPGDPTVGIADETVPFTIPTVLSGGNGNDIIKGGNGPDLILGDDGPGAATWEGVGFTFPDPDADDGDAGVAGADTINAGGGNDVVKAGGGNDTVEGEAGRDTLEGGDGNDTLNGGPGGDAILGQGNDDVLHGGPIPLPAPGATNAEIDDDDALAGGVGSDTVSGDFGNDVLFGDDEVAGFMDADAAMRRLGDGAPDLATWRSWCDAPAAGDGDLLVGNAGDDVMLGQGGDDQLDGDDDDDWACGGSGEDQVVGGDGDDELRGNDDDDVLTGNDGHDVIFGGAGDDTANGNAGGDDIFGDAGSDLLFGDEGDDIVVGDTGSVTPGHVHGVDDGADVSTAKVEALDDAVVRNSSTSGPARTACDVPLGDSDCIFGGAGSDALFGGSDGDLIQGQAGIDLIEGNDGPDNIRGGTDRDLLFGNADGDLMFGDGDADAMYGDRSIDDWTTDTPQGAGVDVMYGGPGTDHMEGDGGDDDMFGGADADHMEGNNGEDDMFGETGNDDMIGGSDTAGEPDVGESVMDGGAGSDVMAGDNAIVGASGFVGGRSVELLDLPIGGDDTMNGAADVDYMFGQIGSDTMSGGDSGDYMEGNDGDDTMNGDAGDDDMVGGGSAADGSITESRNGTGLDDVGETAMNGGTGDDWIAGDNARMNRVLNGDTGSDVLDDHPIQLFDLGVVGGPIVPATAHGPDTMDGGADTDFMFGQGSNDTISGGDAPDYMEGNDGVDSMYGNDGNDDMVGGGSADDGLIIRLRVGEGLFDQGEMIMEGGAGIDWMAGDNAFMNRVLFDDDVIPIDLFDVNSLDEAAVSGGDTVSGGDDDDIIFGQGNGSQGDQSDPPDGLDNDGDGEVDEDGDWDGVSGEVWLGDTIHGDDGDDYAEGNQGSDLIFGDRGDDDLLGGGSAIDGLFVPGRVGDGLWDERDTVHGGDGADVVAGDNARINRGADAQGPVTGLLLGTDREVQLFDVNSGEPAFSGGDFLTGGTERDLMFGQGNGAQSPDQADPLDLVDNDFDGREGPDSTEYDCADNGFDNDDDGNPDGTDSGCLAAIDEDKPWDGDILFGNEGDDYMEGNHGADWMFGGDDEDDMVGGGSSVTGAIVPDRDPAGLLDGPDVMHGDDDDDVMTGDNARVNRVVVDGAFSRIASAGVADMAGFGPYDRAVRVTDMFPGDDGAPGPDMHDDDYMTGGLGDDEMYGQLGDDFAVGNAGDDALVGDLGQVRANVLGDGVGVDPAQVAISTNSPHWDDVINEVGSMLYETELYAFDSSAGGVGGNDVLLGYDGRDTAFGGPGDDVIQGDGDGVEEFFDAVQPEFTHIVDIDPTTADRDMLFGGDGGDAIWGGRDNDILMGGHGDDNLDVRPREATDNGRSGANFRLIPRDPASWFTWAFPENFQDVDFIYGGWDRDALQADQAANGPDPGDRLADWAGGFNVMYLCPAGYGDHTITRMGAPHARDFLRDLTQASGAFLSSVDGSSGFRDLGYVFPNERGANSNPPHPDHPGHFTCADYTQVGAGGVSAEAGGPYEVAEGGSVPLDGSGSSGATSFSWDVGLLGVDDVSSATPTVTAAGLDDGAITVSLEVGDGDGTFRTDTAELNVVNAPPIVTLDALPGITASGSPVTLSAAVTDPGVTDTHTVSIDWGDGSSCDGSAGSECSIATANGAGTVTGTHTYAGPGTYMITVSVVDDDGGTGVGGPASVYVGSAVQTAATWATTDPWPLPDPITIGGVGYTRTEAIAVFATGHNNRQSPFLFRELVAANLNQAAGADASCVTATLTSADAWLADNPPDSAVKKNSSAWTDVAEPWFDELVAYNTGLRCAPAL